MSDIVVVSSVARVTRGARPTRPWPWISRSSPRRARPPG